ENITIRQPPAGGQPPERWAAVARPAPRRAARQPLSAVPAGGKVAFPPATPPGHRGTRSHMDLLAPAAEGFRGVTTDAAVIDRALRHLREWLTEAPFAAYQPQLEWLIGQKQWPGLLDRFYQILPFGTGGRRGPVG